jgi:hypothetical protein
MTSRSRFLSAALALSVFALPAASLAHEGHEHAQPGQTAGAPAGDPNASSQADDEAAAKQAAERRKMADEDAAKAKAEAPTPVAPRGDSGQH